MSNAITSTHCFYLRASESPTYYNISKHLQQQGWRSASPNQPSHFGEQHFDFHLPAAECLEFKNLLSNLVSQYCPEVMPRTYCINDQNWPLVLNQVADECYSQWNPHSQNNSLSDHPGHPIWILKPAHLNNGRHIKIFQNLAQLEQHYLSSNRLGGEQVLQRYLTDPHLLKGPEKGHKYSIRMFVVITNYAEAYLYPEGYFNIALNPYQKDDFTDLRPHLTNEYLKKDEYNVVQIPTQRYDLFKPLYPKIKEIVSAIVNALQKQFPDASVCENENQRKLAICGFDFMVDSDMRVWLLEVNHGPCFPTSDEHPLQKVLYHDFWQSVVTSFVLPIGMGKPSEDIHYQRFEVVNGRSS